ncbi:S1C family serine protease [Bacillus sp. V5-8f]|uniref:S1C family serine protease n=1 Tax=Bacillus sp. V5-8f TaxID=2053044 RepID=UPI000C794F37|nr:trypsin-like peptidase domain-containing protein [Bacillus sp. V5-8f]PLT35780.1 hypothetical protein CUU64_00450 [Bacillus sp. V5-8f]
MKAVWRTKSLFVATGIMFLLSGCGTREEAAPAAGPQTVVKEVKTVQVVEKEKQAAPVKKEKTLKEIIQFSESKVFQVATDSALGSAFLYDNKGHIVTNAHVVTGYKDVEVRTVNDEVLYGTVIGIGDDTDVAVIHVPDLEGHEPLSMATSQAVKGEEVITFGSPNGLKDSVSTGIISGLNRDLQIPPFTYEDVYQTTAPIWPGSSGGPLIHKETGEVLAINSASYINQEALGFSIPIQQVKQFIDTWIANPMQWEEVQEYEDFYNDYDLWEIPDEAYSEYEDSWESDQGYTEEEAYDESESSYEEYTPEEDSSTYPDEEYYEQETEETYPEEPAVEENTDEVPEDDYQEGEMVEEEETEVPYEGEVESEPSEY